jgi:hypothetical protein
MRNPPSVVSIEQKFLTGGVLRLRREFCPWAGISPVTAYAHAKEGRLVISKNGRAAVVTVADARAYVEALSRSSKSA